MKRTLSVQDRGVRVGVLVKIGPDEVAQTSGFFKRLDGFESAVAVVSEDRDLGGARAAENQVEIAVHFNIGCPDAGIPG